MESFNFYIAYIYNIYYLINYYNLKYEWLDITKNNFFDGIKNRSYSNFSGFGNPWLDKYLSNTIELAEDIMENGIFCPFFYQKINDKKYLIMGRHKLYSLLLYSKIKPINRKFLFIEIPNSTNQLQIKDFSKKLFYFNHNNMNPIMYNLKTQKEFFKIIHDTGDALTDYLWFKKSIPYKAFNNENYFQDWINKEFDYEQFLCID